GDVSAISAEIIRFVEEAEETREVDRVLATVLRASVDDGTLDAAFSGIARQEIARWRGREVAGQDGGVLATFDGPTRAVRCACAIRDRARDERLAPRVGVHTGEVEILDHQVSGRTVDACRVMAQ